MKVTIIGVFTLQKLRNVRNHYFIFLTRCSSFYQNSTGFNCLYLAPTLYFIEWINLSLFIYYSGIFWSFSYSSPTNYFEFINLVHISLSHIQEWFKCWNVEVKLLSPKIYASLTLLDSKQLFLKWLYQFTLPLVISGYLFSISSSMKVYQGYLAFPQQEMRLSIFTIYFPSVGFLCAIFDM